MEMSVAVYLAGKVRRWHTHHALSQTVADHSFGVALIIAMFHPNPSANLLKAALFHDLGEYGGVGDVPSPAKRNRPEFSRLLEVIESEARAAIGVPEVPLTDEDRTWLRLADSLEAYMFLTTTTSFANASAFDLDGLLGRIDECARKLGVIIEQSNTRLDPDSQKRGTVQ